MKMQAARNSAFEERYALRMMCAGPYYDPNTKTLRIPHRTRFSCDKIAGVWEEKKFTFDAKRHEYARAIPEARSSSQVQKARAYYFAIYLTFNPMVAKAE